MTNTPTNIATKTTGKVLSLTLEQKKLCDDTAAEIRQFDREAKTAMVQIGAKLIKVKAALGHGHFGKWLKSEVGYTERTAQNYMNVSLKHGDKYETVSHLPVATTYQLAAMPDDKRTEIVSLIKDPENPPVKVIKDKIEDFKNAEKIAKQEKMIKEAKAAKRSLAADITRSGKEKRKEVAFQIEVAEFAEKFAEKIDPELTKELMKILKKCKRDTRSHGVLYHMLDSALSYSDYNTRAAPVAESDDNGIDELALGEAV